MAAKSATITVDANLATAYKSRREALILSVRHMDEKERWQYARR
jgi:hypothetical protein